MNVPYLPVVLFSVQLSQSGSRGEAAVFCIDMEKLLIPLDGKNYPTWKLQARMLLMNLDLWSIVNGSEGPPEVAANVPAYQRRVNKALSTIVLAISPSLLYLIGEPESPSQVWLKLEGHFQNSSWANQFALRKKLYSLVMADSVSVSQHVKSVVELFDGLSAACDSLKEKDRVMILLSSLPRKFDVLITALQSNKTMPTWEEVVEKLVAEEMRQSDRNGGNDVAALYSHHSSSSTNYRGKSSNKKDITCFYCHKPGHKNVTVMP